MDEESNTEGALREGLNRITALHSEKDDIAREIRDEYTRLKDMGFDTKILRKVVARARKDDRAVAEEDQEIARIEALLGR